MLTPATLPPALLLLLLPSPALRLAGPALLLLLLLLLLLPALLPGVLSLACEESCTTTAGTALPAPVC
jgi:hypothetical protein